VVLGIEVALHYPHEHDFFHLVLGSLGLT